MLQPNPLAAPQIRPENSGLRPLPEWIVQVVQEPGALKFLQIMYDTFEAWDDLIDYENTLSSNDIHRVFTRLLIDLPLCQFFTQNRDTLVPALSVGIAAWHASNALRGGSLENRAQSYVLRNEFVNLVVLCVALLHGTDAANLAAIYGWNELAKVDKADEHLQPAGEWHGIA